jgi:hypothetical protein
VGIRVSFETSFDSKQPKLEPKLVSALSETKCLFRLFCFNTESESLDVSIEPKETEVQPKQFDREHILLFFTESLGFFRFFRFFLFFVFFRFFGFVSKQFVWLFRFLGLDTFISNIRYEHRFLSYSFFSRLYICTIGKHMEFDGRFTTVVDGAKKFNFI